MPQKQPVIDLSDIPDIDVTDIPDARPQSRTFMDIMRQPASQTASDIANWIDPPTGDPETGERSQLGAFLAGTAESLIPKTHLEGMLTAVPLPLGKGLGLAAKRFPAIGKLLGKELASFEIPGATRAVESLTGIARSKVNPSIGSTLADEIPQRRIGEINHNPELTPSQNYGQFREMRRRSTDKPYDVPDNPAAQALEQQRLLIDEPAKLSQNALSRIGDPSLLEDQELIEMVSRGATPKPKVKLNPDGTYTPITDEIPAPPVPKPPVRKIVRLPSDLRGAKPRFNFGKDSYGPEFENDLDKALFIIARTNPSKRDRDYLNFVMKHTGLDEVGARSLGRELAMYLKYNIRAGVKPGENPRILNNWMDDVAVAGERGVKNAKNVAASKDPNFNQGMGDSELAGSTGYPKGTTPPIEPPTKLPPIDIDDIPPSSGGGPPPVSPLETPSKLAEIWNFSRGLLPAGDLTSIAFRQARPLMFKKAWWQSWNNTVRAFGSDNAYNQAKAALMEHPLMRPSVPVLNSTTGKPVINSDGTPKLISAAESMGLSLTDGVLNREEERIASTWPEKVPGIGRIVRASNRAASQFANEVRVRALDDMLQQGAKAGMDVAPNSPISRDLAKLVNDMSGRGSLTATIGGHTYSAERYAGLANTWLFSPRLAASQARMFNRWFNPASYINENPIVRQQKIKSLLGIGGFWSSLVSLGSLMGADVSVNPTNSDFLKLKKGNLRLDVSGGLGPWIVMAARLASQQSTSSTTDKTRTFGSSAFASTPASVMGEFAYNKLHPTARFIGDLMRATTWTDGTKYRGMDLTNPNPMKNDITKQFEFMVMQDLYNIAEEDPTLLPLLTVPTVMGMMNSQRY